MQAGEFRREPGGDVDTVTPSAEALAVLADDDRYRLTMELAAVGIAHVGLNGRFLDVNPALCDLLGYTREELLQRGVYDVSFPDDIAVTDDVRARLHSGEISSFQKEKRYIHRDGSVVWVDLKIAVRRDADGLVMYDISVTEDISARKRAEFALRDSEARFRQLVELSSDYYWESDADGCLRRVDGDGPLGDQLRQHLGGRADRIGIEPFSGGRSLYDLVDRRSRFRDERFVIDDGISRHHVSMSGAPTFDECERFTGFRGVVADVTHRIEAEDKIHYLATHDSLTGLPNRATFNELLTHGLASTKRYGGKLAIAFVDLDRFKDINDSLGHSVGDDFLREVGARLRGAVRDSDVVARLGGDEFVVLLQGCDEDEDLAIVAEKILETVLTPWKHGGHECRVSASVGVARFPEDGDDAESLTRHADLAMYAAKESGKNQFQFYNPTILRRSRERFTIENRLRRALQNDEFSLHYQAKLDLDDHSITGVEALLRWRNPELGDVAPVDFIPVAEESGLIVPIGRWVLEQACRQSVEWRRQGLPAVCMAVNLSPKQFSDPNLVADITAVLAETGLSADQLELEVTEGAIMPDPNGAIAKLGELKRLGVRIAIDDFGTGYSSLAQLKRLPIDTLKVDRSFIQDLVESTQDQAITEAIIAMGKTLSLTVVAEGVETNDQLSFLDAKACDEIQGFYFSRPLSSDAFGDLLGTHRSTLISG